MPSPHAPAAQLPPAAPPPRRGLVVPAGWSAQAIPVVRQDAEAQRQSVAQAGSAHPERLTPHVAPAAFDAAAYRADPQRYCDTVEPGRCYQAASTGSGAPPLIKVTPLRVAVPSGASTELVLQVPPRAPATFTAFDGGTFTNGLGSITVQADDEGYARAAWTASPGVVNDAQILAACPLMSGHASYLLNVPPTH